MLDQFSLMDGESTIQFRQAWEHVIGRIAKDVPKNVTDRFLKPLVPVGLEEGVAIVTAPGAFVQEWVRERYLKRIQLGLSEELGEQIKLDLRVEAREKPTVAPVASVATVAPAVDSSPRFKPHPSFRFDTFVVGQSNRLAYAGAKAVAADPGVKYNPLFIYGASGLGKTHLLHSIAHTVLQKDPRYPLNYISAQQFAEDFVFALQNGKIDQFRRSQRNVGIWLVDDIQFVAGKDKTQEEIFHTFNYLQSIGKQIVLCSDRPPRDLFLMDERLRSRFEAGLVADIQHPDTETRCAILLSKAAMEDIQLSHEVAMYLAEQVPGNVRILEGALTKIAAQASLEGSPVHFGLAEGIVEKYYRTSALAKPGVSQIVDVVAKHYKIPFDDIRGQSRKAPIAHARHVAVYITREITGDSWKHIGNQFGDRDHTSMMHAYQKISEMMARDKDLNSIVKMLIRNLYPEV